MLPDLHTHSTASDGTLSPSELVARAAAAGVGVLALTDHDCVAGLAEAEAAAAGQGLRLVPGVELSAVWGGRTIHMVGLGIDYREPVLTEALDEVARFRVWRAGEIARKLAKAGFENTLEGAREYAKGQSIGRTHFARHLIKRGAAKDVREVFKRFMVAGKPGHVPSQWGSVERGLELIHGAGGQAVIAHPARYGFTRTKLKRLIDEFREHGGVGLEVLSGSHTRDDAFTMARHARENQLKASAGSDYHGPGEGMQELGRLAPLPPGCTPIWADWPEYALGVGPTCAPVARGCGAATIFSRDRGE